MVLYSCERSALYIHSQRKERNILTLKRLCFSAKWCGRRWCCLRLYGLNAISKGIVRRLGRFGTSASKSSLCTINISLSDRWMTKLSITNSNCPGNWHRRLSINNNWNYADDSVSETVFGLIIVIVQVIDFGDYQLETSGQLISGTAYVLLVIGNAWTTDLGCCPRLGIVCTIDSGDCRLIGIVRPNDFRPGLLIGIAWTIDSGDVHELELELENPSLRLRTNRNCPDNWFRRLSINWNCPHNWFRMRSINWNCLHNGVLEGSTAWKLPAVRATYVQQYN